MSHDPTTCDREPCSDCEERPRLRVMGADEIIATLTRERDEARAKLEERFKSLDSALELAEATRVQLVEARADAARLRGSCERIANAVANEHLATDRKFSVDFHDAVKSVEAALADTISEAWLAEVRATARDEALEDGAKYIDTKQWHPGNAFGAINPSQASAAVRALKRGGK